MFEQLRRHDDTCLERRSDDDVLRSTSLADRDVTTAIRCTLEIPRQTKGSHSEENSHFGYVRDTGLSRTCDVTEISKNTLSPEIQLNMDRLWALAK